DVESDIPLGLDNFGSALAWGDFNGDGVGDLAVGAPLALIGDAFGPSGGAVGVLFGSQGGGLSSTGSQVWALDRVGNRGPSQDNDNFAATLAGGDFNADGITDLAIGISDKDVLGTATQSFKTIKDAGAVLVLFGGRNVGLTSTGNRFLIGS